MRSIAFRSIAFTVLLTALTPPSSTRPVNGYSVKMLATEADLVVAGRVTEIRTVGTTVLDDNGEKVPTTIREARVDVDHFLKGGEAGEARRSFRYLEPSFPMAYDWPRANRYRIFFLKRVDGELRPVSPNYLSIVAAPASTPRGEDLVDRILSEVAAVLQSPEATVEEKRGALLVLRFNAGPIAIQALADAVLDPIPEVRLAAIAGSLQLKQSSAVEPALKALLQPPPDVSTEALYNVAFAVGAFVDDPNTIPSLLKLQNSEDVIMRRAATHALAMTKSPAVIPALKRALDDADSDTRWEAVYGLSILTNDEVRPSQPEFRADEERYLAHFRTLQTTR